LRLLLLLARSHVGLEVASLFLSISRMSMRQVPDFINNALNKRSDCYEQSREKEHWMDRDAEPDCQRDQQSRCRWFENC
jgi:hypothetical protein